MSVHTVPHVLVRYPLVFATGTFSLLPSPLPSDRLPPVADPHLVVFEISNTDSLIILICLVCAVASRFISIDTVRSPDLHNLATSFAIESLAPYFSTSSSSSSLKPSVDAAIALAILGLWTAPKRSGPDSAPPPAGGAGKDGDVEMSLKSGGVAGTDGNHSSLKSSTSSDDRHAWSAMALRIAEALWSSRDASKENVEDSVDALESPARVLALCHSVDRSIRLNFSFASVSTGSSSSSPSFSSLSSSMPSSAQMLYDANLCQTEDRAARSMALLLRLMNPNGGASHSDLMSNLHACATELDNVLNTLLLDRPRVQAQDRAQLGAGIISLPPGDLMAAVQAGFYRLVAYAMQLSELSASVVSSESLHVQTERQARLDALLHEVCIFHYLRLFPSQTHHHTKMFPLLSPSSMLAVLFR